MTKTTKTTVRYFSDVEYEEYNAIQTEAYDLINYWTQMDEVDAIRDWETRMAAGRKLADERNLAMHLVCEEHGLVYGDSPKARREMEAERRFESRF